VLETCWYEDGWRRREGGGKKCGRRKAKEGKTKTKSKIRTDIKTTVPVDIDKLSVVDTGITMTLLGGEGGGK